MERARRTIAALFVLASLLLCQAGSSTPWEVSYSGQLTDEVGTPLTSPQNVRVRFFPVESGGLPLSVNLLAGPYVAPGNPSPLDVGNTFLGDCTSRPNCLPLTLNGTGVFTLALYLSPSEFNTVFADITVSRWIEVAVGTVEGTSFTATHTYPRQRFTATPYCLKVPVDGNVVTYNPNGQLTIAATSIADDRLATISSPGKVSGSAITSGTIGGSTTINTSGNIITTGSIGIGTTPGAKLDVAGDIRLAGSLASTVSGGQHISNLPWFNSADGPAGYIKLVTPIVHNESNMFSIRIFGYHYSAGGRPIDIRCGGYAYGATTLINTYCHTQGTSLPVEIGPETRAGTTVVVIRIGTPTSTWYFDHFSAEYVGWQTKAATGFQWIMGEITPAQTGNTHNVVIDDQGGTVTAGSGSFTSSLMVSGSPVTTGAGSSNYIAKWTGPGSLGSSPIAVGGDNVGIGTNSPSVKLDVAGEIRPGNSSATCSASTEGSLRYNGATKSMQFCNGTQWGEVGGTSSAVQSPIGAIVAWHKSKPGTPALPSNWLECNGQTVNDAASPYNGTPVPNLNSATQNGSTDSGMFLRGAPTSGTVQADATATNSLYLPGGVPVATTMEYGAGFVGWGSAQQKFPGIQPYWASIYSSDPETRPANMSVVWIIRVK